MFACWKENPQDRPSFVELRAKFDALLADQKTTPKYIELCDNKLTYPTEDNCSIDNEAALSNASPLLSTSQKSCAMVGSVTEAEADTNQFKWAPSNTYVRSPTHAVSQEQLKRPTCLSIPNMPHQATNPLTSPSQYTPGMASLHLSELIKPQVFSGGCSSTHL